MASETIDPIGWSHPPPSWAVPPELHILHGVNVAYKWRLAAPAGTRTRIHRNARPTHYLCGHSVHLASFYFQSYPLPPFLNSSFCPLVLIPPCCSHAQVFWTTLVHELHIFCSCTGWCLFFSRGEMVISVAEVSHIKKLNYNNSNYDFVIRQYLVANCKLLEIAISGKY